MDDSSSWEVNSQSAGQEIPRLLWNPKLHCRIHKSPQVFTVFETIIIRRPLTSKEQNKSYTARTSK